MDKCLTVFRHCKRGVAVPTLRAGDRAAVFRRHRRKMARRCLDTVGRQAWHGVPITAGAAVFRQCSGRRRDGVQILQAGKSGMVFRYCSLRQVIVRRCSDIVSGQGRGVVTN